MSLSRAIRALGLDDSQYNELKRMLPGQKLQAIERYAAIAKVNKAEARAVIEAMQAGKIPGGGPAVVSGDTVSPEAVTGAFGSPHVTDEQNEQIRKLLETNKAEAIQLYHSLTTGGFDEAKDVIAAMESALKAPRPSGPAPDLGRTATRLAALLPSGSRPPTPAEVATISSHVAKGDFDAAAMQIGAGWGVDQDEALRMAKGLRGRSNVLGCVFFLVAMLLVLGLLGAVATMVLQK